MTLSACLHLSLCLPLARFIPQLYRQLLTLMVTYSYIQVQRSSIRPTAAPYVCRTGNITLRCQYGGVENVLAVLWSIGDQTTTANPSNIPGHTALPRTTTYHEVVVDSYTNLAAGYRCTPALSNGSLLGSNPYHPQYECECYQPKSTLLVLCSQLYRSILLLQAVYAAVMEGIFMIYIEVNNIQCTPWTLLQIHSTYSWVVVEHCNIS